jgi:hypothetical protein
MKKIFTILTFLTVTSIFATDRFVDPTLSSGNGTTLFTTIKSAVNAAVNDDRIIIVSTTYNEPALTISKSLQIMPQTPGTIINFNANIIIGGFAGMKLEITGFNLGIYSFSSNSITSGSYANRAKISIIECSAANANFDNEFYELNLIKNIFTGDVNLKYGNVVQSIMSNCYLFDESLTNQSLTDKILITNNTINDKIVLFNDDYRYIVSNNLLNNIFIKRWNPNSLITNSIINNEFLNNCIFLVTHNNVPNYNLKICNNKFNGSIRLHKRLYFGVYAATAPINDYNSKSLDTNCGGYPTDACGYGNSTDFPNPITSGFFEWSYNGVDLACPIPSGSQPLSLTKIVGPTDAINGGNPNHNYYDIDLSINDRGINGGPYSNFNYNPGSNTNNSKAFIFDLDMPTDLFPGQSIDIKAKGYHKN